MDYTGQLKGIIDEYLLQVERLLEESKPADGLLGMGKAPQHAPCHDAFDRQVEQLVRRCSEATDASSSSAIVECLLQGEKNHPAHPSAAWMLIAVQRHSTVLIPQLTQEEAKYLLAWYTTAYPVYQRLPIQREIVRQLRKRAEASCRP